MRREPKTPQAVRDVVLMPALGRLLAAEKLRRGRVGETDPVFASRVGTPLHFRNVSRRGLDEAVAAAGIKETPKLRFHDLRHTFASLLIAKALTRSS